jgi:FeS assembly SUF system regulator
MRLSRLADYAIMLMTHVAQHPAEIHAAGESAAATRLPVPTVARVMARLRRAGLLTSERGVKGGYRLARPAADVPVGAIVSLFDGPVMLTRCAQAGPRRCEVEALCPSRIGLQRLNLAVRQALDDVTLAELAQPVMSIARSTKPARTIVERHTP